MKTDFAGESLSDIHAAARLVNIDERSPVPGMVRLPLHPSPAGGASSAASSAANRGIYSTTTAHRDHTHGMYPQVSSFSLLKFFTSIFMLGFECFDRKFYFKVLFGMSLVFNL